MNKESNKPEEMQRLRMELKRIKAALHYEKMRADLNITGEYSGL